MSFQTKLSYQQYVDNKTPWCIACPEGIKYVNDLDYLNHLLEKTPETIKSQDILRIKFLYWDFSELKQAGVSPLFQMTLDSQLNALKRILKYTPIKEYVKNTVITIDSDEEGI